MKISKVVTATLLTLCVAVNTLAADVGDKAPDWVRPNLDKAEISYPHAANGRPSILLFWATWCPYCRALMPYLDTIRDDYADQGVQVFAVNIKEDGDPVAHMRKLGFDFVTVLDGDPVAESYGVRYTPGLFVVDKNGVILFRRKSTDSKPGKSIAEFWEGQVRIALDVALADETGE